MFAPELNEVDPYEADRSRRCEFHGGPTAMSWKSVLILICVGAPFLTMAQTPSGGGITQRAPSTADSPGCKKPAKSAIDKASTRTRGLPEDSLAIFDSEGKLRREVPLQGKK